MDQEAIRGKKASMKADFKTRIITTSLDEGTPSEVRFLEWSLCKPEPKAFLRGNVSTAPENLSRISCPRKEKKTKKLNHRH